MKQLILNAIRIGEILLAPAVLAAGLTLKLVRRIGVHRLPVSRYLLRKIGVFPIRDHYYEPLFRTDKLKTPLDQPRALPGIDFRIEKQLALLDEFKYADELRGFPIEDQGNGEFFYHNQAFESGDAEILYSVVRHFKPTKIIEIGSGMSTLIAQSALKANRLQDGKAFQHTCIEPYEHSWLSKLEVDLIRQPVETMSLTIFEELKPNDILFIDSSHIIRPQGDVLFEYLQILPRLKPGVLVHVHDIFSPRDYLSEWIVEEVKLWNEQYLLEAFLSGNSDYQVLLSTNFLAENYSEKFAAACPVYASEAEHREPGSFWIWRAK